MKKTVQTRLDQTDIKKLIDVAKKEGHTLSSFIRLGHTLSFFIRLLVKKFLKSLK